MRNANGGNQATNTKPNSRKLRVYYAFSDNRFTQNYNYPVIRIGGKYLRTFGFEIGTRLQVDLTHGQIVVSKIDPESQ